MNRKLYLTAFVAWGLGSVLDCTWHSVAGAATPASTQPTARADEGEQTRREIDWLRSLHPTPACPVPAALKQEQLVAFGTYEGDSIASATIGGPDQETNLIDVVVEPGRQPLYLVLTSYESMIWRFSGATSRVRKVVISSYHEAERSRSLETSRRPPSVTYDDKAPAQAWRRVAASGAVGLPAEKVVIAPAHCPRYFHEPKAAITALARASEALGRDPDATFGTYTAQRVHLPSGLVTKAERDTAPVPRGFDREMWLEATRFWRGGLVYVSPRDVVAAAPVTLYEVLPSQMGLSQLIGAGALEPLSRDKFRVLRPIPHLPPSMGGAHSVTLILAEGVPMPQGNPVHSCVVYERDEHLLDSDGICLKPD